MGDVLKADVLPGDRWDLLADRQYGDPYGYVRILRANPPATIGVPAAIFPARQTLTVPIIEVETSVEDLPPWLR